MNDAEQMFAEALAAWGVSLHEQQRIQFAQYATLLQAWNAHTNLTAITAPAEIYRRHFLDSVSLMQVWGEAPRRLIDIGAGAGFPGVPLKLLYPELQLTLVDSVGKKTAFLRELVATLRLTDVQIHTARAETLGQDATHREHYDVVVARAVAELRVLVEYTLPLARVGGRVLAPKGAAAPTELAAATNAIAQLGGAPAQVVPLDLPGQQAAVVVCIDKRAPTDPQFPRAVGLPSRRPL